MAATKKPLSEKEKADLQARGYSEAQIAALEGGSASRGTVPQYVESPEVTALKALAAQKLIDQEEKDRLRKKYGNRADVEIKRTEAKLAKEAATAGMSQADYEGLSDVQKLKAYNLGRANMREKQAAAKGVGSDPLVEAGKNRAAIASGGTYDSKTGKRTIGRVLNDGRADAQMGRVAAASQQERDKAALAQYGTIAVDPRYAGPGQITTEVGRDGGLVRKPDTIWGAGAGPTKFAQGEGYTPADASYDPVNPELNRPLTVEDAPSLAQFGAPDNSVPLSETPGLDMRPLPRVQTDNRRAVVENHPEAAGATLPTEYPKNPSTAGDSQARGLFGKSLLTQLDQTAKAAVTSFKDWRKTAGSPLIPTRRF